jgi:predicted RNase H-like nuclease
MSVRRTTPPTGAGTASGLQERRKLRANAGILIPDRLPNVRRAGPDDVLDAAVAAWTALRVHRKTAQALPAEPPIDTRGRRVAIWYWYLGPVRPVT